jgi:hypothetical protein
MKNMVIHQGIVSLKTDVKFKWTDITNIRGLLAYTALLYVDMFVLAIQVTNIEIFGIGDK